MIKTLKLSPEQLEKIVYIPIFEMKNEDTKLHLYLKESIDIIHTDVDKNDNIQVFYGKYNDIYYIIKLDTNFINCYYTNNFEQFIKCAIYMENNQDEIRGLYLEYEMQFME